MNSLFDIAQASDAAFNRDLNRHLASEDNSAKAHDDRVKELREEYLEDEVMVWDILLDESCVDADEIQETMRAALVALKYNTGSFDILAKSFFLQLLEGVDKRAEMRA